MHDHDLRARSLQANVHGTRVQGEEVGRTSKVESSNRGPDFGNVLGVGCCPRYERPAGDATGKRSRLGGRYLLEEILHIGSILPEIAEHLHVDVRHLGTAVD